MYRNWTEGTQFNFWEYLFRHFGILSLLCTWNMKNAFSFSEGLDATFYLFGLYVQRFLIKCPICVVLRQF